MTDSIGRGLLDHSLRLLDSLESIGNAYNAYERGDSDKLQVMQVAWKTTLPICIEVGKLTTDQSGELADWIRDVGLWCKWFAETVKKHGFAETVFTFNCDGVNRVLQSGRELLGRIGKVDDPFAFVEEGGLHTKVDSNDPESPVASPFQILAKGNLAIAKAAHEVTRPLRAYSELLGDGKNCQQRAGNECRVDSRFPKPDDSLTKDAIQHLQKIFHKLPHAGTAKANHVIADAVKGGIQRNAVEWALMRMQEYGWIKLSIPVWGGVIGSNRSELATHLAMREPKRTQWYFGTQEYDVGLTKYFYEPHYCITCSQPLESYDYYRSECHDCSSQQGKLLDLYVAIHASGDSPDRIREWPMIRALLRDAFGSDHTIEELWELMTDRLRVNGWDEERWLRTKYGEFIESLNSGLLDGRSIARIDDSAMTPSNTPNAAPSLSKTNSESDDPLDSNNATATQNCAKSLESIKLSERQAYYSYKLAEAKAELRLEDREAYNLLVENDFSEFLTGDLVDYKLPAFATWSRQLRTARKATNERKYTPRTHR